MCKQFWKIVLPKQKTKSNLKNLTKITFFFILLNCLALSLTSAQTFSEYQFKAGIIQRLAKYTNFPPEAFESKSQRITLGILGNDPFGDVMDRVLRGRPVHGRFWKIKRVTEIKDLWGCHVVFVCKSEADKIADVTAFCGKYPTLTIGDGLDNFVNCGGIVNFTNKGKFGFELNAEAIKKSKLVVDAKILQLASNIARFINCN